MTNETPIIEAINLDKFYGDFHALKDVNLKVHPSEKMVICGPSGSGKSTLIRCFNGLEWHNSGTLKVDGVEVYEGSKDILTLRQEVGMVFQQFNLFPHLTVLENLTIGPMKVRKVSKEKAEETARHYLDRVHIPDPEWSAAWRAAAPGEAVQFLTADRPVIDPFKRAWLGLRWKGRSSADMETAAAAAVAARAGARWAAMRVLSDRAGFGAGRSFRRHFEALAGRSADTLDDWLPSQF